LNKGHNKGVDWYCLGVFMFEIMTGQCPYISEDPIDIFKMILNTKIRFPKGFDRDAKSLIKHLCCHDVTKRYGNLKGGADDVKQHRFFNEINFHQVLSKQIKPVYVPDDKSRARKLKMTTTGTKVANISENTDDKNSPVIMTQDDPFIAWFK
jgi:protein kinase X